jgi:hypothetical protein
MTAVPRVTGSKLLVQIGDGGGPETFTHDCFINTERGIAFSTETTESIMPDCDNPDDPAWKSVSKDGLMATVSGAGMLYSASVETWFNWLKSGNTKNCRINLNIPGSSGGGYWAGAFHLTQFEIQASGNKETITAQVTLVSSGALTWTDNA